MDCLEWLCAMILCLSCQQISIQSTLSLRLYEWEGPENSWNFPRQFLSVQNFKATQCWRWNVHNSETEKNVGTTYTIDHNDIKMNVNNKTESKSPSFFSFSNSILVLEMEKLIGTRKVNNVHAEWQHGAWANSVNSFPNGKHSHVVGWEAICRLCDTDLTVYSVLEWKAPKPFRLVVCAIKDYWARNSCGSHSSCTRNIQNIETLLAQASVSHRTLNRTVAPVLLPLVTKIQNRKRSYIDRQYKVYTYDEK